MYHYTYEITYTDGTKYIGVRTSKCLPILDTDYIGSSKYTPNTKVHSKLILAVFETRELALKHECYLQRYNNVVVNPIYWNKAIQTSVGFDTTGIKLNFTQEHKDKIAKASTGRLKTAEEKAKLSKSKLGLSTGPRTEATKLAISKANSGRKYPDRVVNKASYTSRLKFADKYMWINNNTFEHLYASTKEIADRLSVKSARFNKLIKGTAYTVENWSLVCQFTYKYAHKSTYLASRFKSRLTFTDKFTWLNTATLETHQLTTQELSLKTGIKTARFNTLINNKAKHVDGWALLH